MRSHSYIYQTDFYLHWLLKKVSFSQIFLNVEMFIHTRVAMSLYKSSFYKRRLKKSLVKSNRNSALSCLRTFWVPHFASLAT